MGQVFVTGTYRSGTTLVEKLLHSLPGVSVASQPFPLLYIEAKRAFLASLGYHDPHPLGPLFLEDRYTQKQLHRFLDDYELSRDEVQELIAASRGMPGFWSPELLERADEVPGGTFVAVRGRVTDLLAEIHGQPDAAWRGSKEIICEEYVPYLLQRGDRVVMVVRDPRAVLASLYLGEGPSYAGQVRPVLFHLRNWRKSVAFALACQGQLGFLVLRYEDVVREPATAVERLAGLLGLVGVAVPALDELSDQRGQPWTANTSFAAVGDDQVRPRLGQDVHEYVETVCWPELRALGYGQGRPDAEIAELELDEPLQPTDALVAADLSTDPSSLRQEQDRLGRLRPGLDPDEARRWFVHPGAYRRLLRHAGRPTVEGASA